MKRGLSLEIPNYIGSFLGDVLKPFDVSAYNWRITSCESYKVIDGLADPGKRFLKEAEDFDGEKLKDLLENVKYYVIFADLQAYPKGETSDIKTYKEFIISKCELALILVDSSYVAIYCKNKGTIELLYNNARDWGFENIKYITDDNDKRIRLSVW